MKILYDFRAFQMYHQRGVSRYVHHLFESAIRQSGELAYILLFSEMVTPTFSAQVEKKIIRCYPHDFDSGYYREGFFDAFVGGACFWLNTSAEVAFDALYPDPVMRCCRVKTVIMHDLIPLYFPKYFATIDDKTDFILQIEATKPMDCIFTNSEFTKYAGVRYLDLPAERFTCIYGGADEDTFRSQNSAAPYAVSKRKNHLVYTSGLAEHKNNEGLVKAFCKAYRHGILPEDARLYIVCWANSSFIENMHKIAETEGCQYGKQVVATGFIPDEELVDLLASARASIFPSFIEGLGLPILESYVAGTPSWASSVSSTKEFVLPECTFDPFVEQEMINAIKEIYNNPSLCEKSLAFGRKLIQAINWETSAKKMLDTLQDLSRK